MSVHTHNTGINYLERRQQKYISHCLAVCVGGALYAFDAVPNQNLWR